MVHFAGRRSKRLPARLLAAASGLVALAAALLLLTFLDAGKVELRLRLGLAGLASGAEQWAPAPAHVSAATAPGWAPQALPPPLPEGDPPTTQEEEGQLSFDDPYADLKQQAAGGQQRPAPRGGGSSPKQPAGSSKQEGKGGRQQAENQASGMQKSCGDALGIKKVALLFLTTRRLAHERLWRLWLWDAVNLLPQQAAPVVQDGVCGPEAAAAATWRQIRAACPLEPERVTAAGVTTELPLQHLFSIYVHTGPDYQGLEYQPLFQGRVIPTRLQTWWGHFSILDAELALLREAIRDPLNERFVLISDSDIPLYDALTTYQQLMWEGKSRVKACYKGYMNDDRWRDEMATDHMKRHHWRKSNQFFSLTRRHAEMVVQDTEVYRSFKNQCGSGGWNSRINAWKECIADEHYVPTLLAVLGQADETYCDGWGIAYTDWTRGGQHPRSFLPKELTPALVKDMRWGCGNGKEAGEDAERMFTPIKPLLALNDAKQACSHLAAVFGGGSTNSSSSSSRGNSTDISSGSSSNSSSSSVAGSSGSTSYAHPIDGKCPLTGRKFPPYTALRARQLFLASCPNGGGGAAAANSKAAQMLHAGVGRDPQVVLLRGQACTPEVQQQVLARGPSAAAGASLGRRLLCTVAAAGWLPEAAADIGACDELF